MYEVCIRKTDHTDLLSIRFRFASMIDTLEFVKTAIAKAHDDIVVSIIRYEDAPTTTVYDACSGERKEYPL